MTYSDRKILECEIVSLPWEQRCAQKDRMYVKMILNHPQPFLKIGGTIGIENMNMRYIL